MTVDTAIQTRRAAPKVRSSRQRHLLLKQLAVGIVLLVLWDLTSGTILNPAYFSSPGEVANRLAELLRSGQIQPHIRTTLTEFASGYALGATLGILVGVSFGVMTRTAKVVQPLIMALYSIPKIALAPFFVMIFGIGIRSKIALVTMSVFFFVFLSTFHGVRRINHELVNLARIMGASPLLVARKVMLPSALPSVLTGLRGSVPYGIIGAIVAEYVASREGLGWFIKHAGQTLDGASMLSGVAILVVTSFVALRIISTVERLLIGAWQPKKETRVAI